MPSLINIQFNIISYNMKAIVGRGADAEGRRCEMVPKANHSALSIQFNVISAIIVENY
jgi:hypothetical protein